MLVSYYTNEGLVLLKLACIVLSLINTCPCYVKSVSVCIIVYIYFDSYDMPTTMQTQTDFTWKPYRSLKGGVCY